jgi:hypothetical protein
MMKTRRDLLCMALAGVLGAAPLAAAAGTLVERRQASGFDEVLWDLAGELSIEQGAREGVEIEAEPAVLARVTSSVSHGRLTLAFAPGAPIATRLPLRVRVELRALRSLESRGSGSTRIGPLRADDLRLELEGSGDLVLARLDARRLEVRLTGSGDVDVGGGTLESQRIVLEGSGNVRAARLDSRDTEATIAGSGTIEVAASRRLVARIDGSGDIRYRGDPAVSEAIGGAGTVARAAR